MFMMSSIFRNHIWFEPVVQLIFQIVYFIFQESILMKFLSTSPRVEYLTKHYGRKPPTNKARFQDHALYKHKLRKFANYRIKNWLSYSIRIYEIFTMHFVELCETNHVLNDPDNLKKYSLLCTARVINMQA